jgi:hypothetical protein
MLLILPSVEPDANITDASVLHTWNALVSILVTELGIVIDVNVEQIANADNLILVTEVGIVIDDNSTQPKNVCSSIIVNNELVGSVTDANELQL